MIRPPRGPDLGVRLRPRHKGPLIDPCHEDVKAFSGYQGPDAFTGGR
jgi:hypothetical protein